MLSPEQQYAKARSMPIAALAAVLDGKSDAVSMAVAHAMIKEKTEAEVAKRGAEAMQMAQAQKVRDKDLALARGIASTPADLNVPMGGIVGGDGGMAQTAAGGGSVVAFQAGGTPPTFGGMMATQAARAPGFMGYLRQGLGAADRFATGRGGMLGPSLALTPTAANVGEQEYLDLLKKLASMGYSAEVIEAMTPDQRVAAAARGPLQAGPTDTGGVATQSLADLEAAQKEQAGAAGATGAAKPPSGAPSAGGLASLGGAGVGQTFAQMMQTSKDLAGQFMSDAEAPKTAAQVMADYNKTLKEAGYDFNLLSKQMGDVAKEKEELKGDKEEAVNLRLLEAGLGILGGESPYAFVNIGKGATPALQGLAKDIKEIQKRRKEYDKETRQLQMMQNQMAEGRGKYTFDVLEKQKAEQRRAKEREEAAKLDMFKSMWQNQTALKVAQISASREGDTLRAIREMPGDTLGEKAAAWTKATNKRLDPAEAAYIKTLETYATEDPGGRKLERLKDSNPALYARLKQDLATFGLSTGMLTEKPDTGPIRN